VKLGSGIFLSVAALALGVSAAVNTGAGAAPMHRVNAEAVLGVEQLDGTVGKYPRTLSEYGFFLDAAGRIPSDTVIPYALNTALYSDGADKLRYIFLPDGAAMTDAGEGGLLDLPVGSAIIKTFAFGEKYIETRLLLHRADGWLALPYKWNEDQTEAKLALVGARMELTRPDGQTISYQIPNKNQCKACHSLDDAVLPIGPKARNLAPELLASLAASGKLSAHPDVAKPMPLWRDASASTEARARAYLDVNCAHCHRPGGGASNSGLDLTWEQDDPFAIGVNKPPVAAGRGAGGLLVSIEPGQPDASILVHRMDSTEPGVAMPELGRSTIDTEAVALMREWIADMEPQT